MLTIPSIVASQSRTVQFWLGSVATAMNMVMLLLFVFSGMNIEWRPEPALSFLILSTPSGTPWMFRLKCGPLKPGSPGFGLLRGCACTIIPRDKANRSSMVAEVAMTAFVFETTIFLCIFQYPLSHVSLNYILDLYLNITCQQ